MKSALRRLTAQSKPPVPLSASAALRGHSFSLIGGKDNKEAYLRAYSTSGTLFSIVSLYAQSAATPEWHMYKKAPRDGRVRYSTADRGSDQRIEVMQHAALSLLNNPNDFCSRFEFFEGSNQHLELCGEFFWVLEREGTSFPTGMWYVRPDRMEPIPDKNNFLLGWIYMGPDGEQIPLKRDEVIQEKLPNPEDPYRGAGPVASILPNLQQQRYATEYQRNLFINGADPGGIIEVPNNLTDTQFSELIDRWRETHQGVARAGRVGVLENGNKWIASGNTNRDLEYSNLRATNRDEIREAYRMHKSMLGTVEDVNRANAQTAEEVFASWGILPRLDRRRNTLNNKFLPMFGSASQGVEFDYDDPTPGNREADNAELIAKATAAKTLTDSGYDPEAVLEVVGLPAMAFTGLTGTQPSIASEPAYIPNQPVDRERIAISNKRDTVAKVVELLSKDYPPDSMSWVHHTTWMGPLKIKSNHVDLTGYDNKFGRSEVDVEHFRDQIEKKGKTKPVILVKTPGSDLQQIVDGHARVAAYVDLHKPIWAYVGVTNQQHGGWETMHDHQDIAGAEVGTHSLDSVAIAQLLNRPFATRAVGTSWNRG